jgi:hypothetical protein
MNTNHKSICLRLVAHASRVLVAVSRRNELRKSKSGDQERGKLCSSCPCARVALLTAIWLPSRWMKVSEPDLARAELIASLFPLLT